MTDTPFTPGRPLVSDAELQQTLEALLGSANRRQFWTLFFDDEHRFVGPFMPMDDHPPSPDALTPTDDLGALAFSEVVLHRIGSIAELISASSFVLVWERLGAERFTSDDRDWARAFSSGAAITGIRLRTQFLLHDAGLRLLTPDDYA